MYNKTCCCRHSVYSWGVITITSIYFSVFQLCGPDIVHQGSLSLYHKTDVEIVEQQNTSNDSLQIKDMSSELLNTVPLHCLLIAEKDLR